jgi:hypothetical protein
MQKKNLKVSKGLVKYNFPIKVGGVEERGASSRERCALFLGTSYIRSFLRKLFLTESKAEHLR